MLTAPIPVRMVPFLAPGLTIDDSDRAQTLIADQDVAVFHREAGIGMGVFDPVHHRR